MNITLFSVITGYNIISAVIEESFVAHMIKEIEHCSLTNEKITNWANYLLQDPLHAHCVLLAEN